MDLSDLQQSLKDKTPEELTELLRGIRQSRRTSKQHTKKTIERKAVAAIKTASKDKIFKAVDALTEEQKQALLADLLSAK